jgi:colicin import membrane protein
MATFIGILSFIAFIIGIIALIKGGMPRLGIKNRLVGLLVAVLSFLLLIIMIIVGSPEPASEITEPAEEIEAVDEELEEIEESGDDENLSHFEYVSLLDTNTKGLGAALTEFGGLALEFELTDDWISAAAFQVATIRFYAEEAEKIIPPEKYQDVHSTYLQGTRKIQESMDWFVEGIDELDMEKLDKATELMIEGGDYIDQASEKLSALE